MATELGRKASEAYTAAAALANPYTKKLAEAIANATKEGKEGLQKRGGSDTFGFLDNMCGPMLRNFNNGDDDDDDDLDDLTEREPRNSRSRGGRNNRRSSGRRPQSSLSYDYDDETNATDITGSYDEDDDTYDDDEPPRRGSSSRKSRNNNRGRDRKPRNYDDNNSESEYDDDTTKGDSITDASSAYYHDSKKDKKSSKSKSNNNNNDSTGEKLITQPLASGFAKRCYFTKAGIGRTSQHYEGLTLTGNTVLMLAAAMKLKGCPTICDEDLRRVEQTYPNQFSRLPDELLLSSGWRRISKYCHFSHKPLPDGVPFFHSRKRCHPNGGFYFLLCSAVGMTRLLDVEPLNKDALTLLETDFPLTCDKAPNFLMGDPNEWTLVNKFCFFSGGPINIEEDVYYRAELGGTAIFMLAFLSPSLSPEELYRLKQPAVAEGQQEGGDTGPLKSVAAVEEVESVYDLTERDFDDLKLYHLGPCRALPPYLLHPEAWIKVLPPHFLAAREEAMRIAQEFEGPLPVAPIVVPQGQGDEGGDNMMGGENSGGYVELGQAGHPSSRGGNMPPQPGPGYPPPQQYSGMQDPNAPYYPPPPPQQGGPGGIDQAGFPQQQPQHHHQQQQYGMEPAPLDGDMNYYYGGMPPQQPGGQHSQFQQPMQQMNHNPYGNPNMGAPSPDRMNAGQYNSGQHQQYENAPHWRDIQEEGAFGGGTPHDESGMYGGGGGGGMYGGDMNNGAGGMIQHQTVDGQMGMDPPMMDPDGQYPGNAQGASDIGLPQDQYQGGEDRPPQRQDLSTKLGVKGTHTPGGEGTVGDDSTWDSRTDGDYSEVSSAFTDNTNPNERNSRRALILQMAKARMKNSKASEKKEEGKIETTQESMGQDDVSAGMSGLELD